MPNRWWGPRSDSPWEENPLKHIRDQMPATEPHRAGQTFTFDAGNAPRVFLRKQVEQVLDKVDLFDDFGWCRVAGGSEQTHRVTADGVRLVESDWGRLLARR